MTRKKSLKEQGLKMAKGFIERNVMIPTEQICENCGHEKYNHREIIKNGVQTNKYGECSICYECEMNANGKGYKFERGCKKFTPKNYSPDDCSFCKQKQHKEEKNETKKISLL